MTKRRVMVAAGFALSVVLLWWALHDTDLGSILDRARAVDVPLMVLAIVAGIASLPLRAARWRQSLAHLDEPPSMWAAYHATTLGAFANNVLPARAGEVVAVSVLSRLSSVAFVPAGAALGLTHVVDIAVLIALAGVGLLVDAPMSGVGDGETVRNVLLLGTAAVAVALVGTWVLLSRSRDPASASWFGRLAHRVADGLRAFQHPRLLAPVIGWTVVLWLVTGTAWWLGLRALDLDISYPTALVVQTVVAMGIALPSAPGFFGPFESAARIGLSLYVVDAAAGAESAVAFHVLVFFFPVVALGCVSLLLTGLRPAGLRDRSPVVVDAPAPAAV